MPAPYGQALTEMTKRYDMRDDTSYFYDRAETELELAQRATHPLAVRAHYIIANHYLDRCYGAAGHAPAVAAPDDTPA